MDNMLKKQKEEAKNKIVEINTKILISAMNLHKLNLPLKRLDKNKTN